MRIVVGITGASGAVLGVTLLRELAVREVETHLILSRWATETLALECRLTPQEVAALASFSHAADDLTAPVASGSFRHDGMIIVPCSMKTCAAIAHGLADNLLVRAADVTLKERRRLILAARETPLSAIHLKNLLILARAGAIIAPPVMSFYHQPSSTEDMARQFTGRMLDLLGIESELAVRWGEPHGSGRPKKGKGEEI
ncbi:MAG TPA: UbiX family flavin prenyltransferase [Spirochaetia bacterium]|nr:UbiX family flavin prenyltransferase [Spirochaetia bacterium]